MRDRLPEGWALCHVQEVFSSFGGGTPNRNHSTYWGREIPWLSSGDIKSEWIDTASEHISTEGLRNSSARLCRAGSVLVVVRSGILKHTLPVGVLTREAAINQDIKCFDSGNNDMNLWLALALRESARKVLAVNREGTTVQSVKYETLNAFELAVPPLKEQRRITEKLRKSKKRLDACHERLAKITILLKRFRQSILASACSGRLTRDWRGDGQTTRPVPPVIIGSPEATDLLPGWEWRLLTDVSRLESGHTPRKTVSEYWDHGDVPWISLQDIRQANGKVILETKLMPTKLGIENSSARILPKGTVVLSRDISVGYVTIMGSEMATTQHFANWICGPKVNNHFLMYALIASRDSLLASGQGSTVKTIYMPALMKMRILLPPPVEQREIVRRIETLFSLADQIEAHFENAQILMESLAGSLVSKAFRGELVRTEADLAREEGRDYEPASVLLDRIRAMKRPTSKKGMRFRGKPNLRPSRRNGGPDSVPAS